MANYTIILGENGQGKTRYLLKTLKENIGPASIAVISNAAINPFPIQKNFQNTRYALFNIKAQGSLEEHNFTRQLYNRINTLVKKEIPEDIFYVLDFLGFDEIIRVKISPLYVLNMKSSIDGSYKYGLKRRYSDFGRYFNEHLGLPLEEIELNGNLNKIYSEYFKSNLTIDFTPHGAHTGYAHYNKIMSDLKAIDKLILGPSSERASLFNKRYSVSKEGVFFNLEESSSGELYIFGLGLFIRRTIEEFKKRNGMQEIIFLIDEPENSLHPKWQKEYIDFINACIGYENVNVIIATHSPFIAVGGELHDASIYKIDNGKIQKETSNLVNSNIEQIYLELFDLLTPKNKFLSELCNDVLKKYAEGYLDYQNSLWHINSLINKTYDEKQRDFLLDIKQLLNKIHANKIQSGESDDRIF